MERVHCASGSLTQPARNSAFVLTSLSVLLIGGFVLSGRRPGPHVDIIALQKQTSAGKMFTLTGSVRMARLFRTLWEPAPVSDSLIRGEGGPGAADRSAAKRKPQYPCGQSADDGHRSVVRSHLQRRSSSGLSFRCYLADPCQHMF